MKLNILAFGVHPDDVELSCAGTLMAHIDQGYKVGIVDLTRGELGTRGTPELRLVEAQNAGEIIGVEVRNNLGMRDGFFKNDEAHQLQIIEQIRQYQPDIVLANATEDRHPDHGRSAELVRDAFFLSGLRMIETKDADNNIQEPWRPRLLLHYIQDRWLNPDIVVDISPYIDRKIEAVKAFSSQFYDPNSNEPATYIASKSFFDSIPARAKEAGRASGFEYAEGFTSAKFLGIKDLNTLL